MKAQVIELTVKIVDQERTRDRLQNEKEVKNETDERLETYDTFASFVNDYYQLKNDLVQVESEVYNYG